MAIAVVACGKKPPAPPEADPAKIAELAKKMVANVPTPGAIPACEDAQLTGGAAWTFRTVLQLAGENLPKDPEHAPWINMTELEAAPVRVLGDDKADALAKRRAAAELLAAPFFVVYHVDMVNAPFALGIKELKLGTVGARAIRYDKTGTSTCVKVFYFQNDKAKQAWAEEKTPGGIVMPEVAKAMQDDLRVQFLAHAPGLAPAKKPQ